MYFYFTNVFYCLRKEDTYINVIEDEQLLRLIAAGDGAAFAQLYHRHWECCYTTAFRMLRQEQLAEDIVQDIFIKLWEGRERFTIQSVRPYLQKAVRNRVLNAVRDQKTDDHFYTRLAAITADILDENPVYLRENQQLFQQIIISLPEDLRETFSLSRLHQMSYKEIALQLVISEKTVEKRISRALQYIRDNYSHFTLLVLATYSW